MILEKDNLKIYFKSSELMEEIPDKSVDLFISGSLYLGKEWQPYYDLFKTVYLRNGLRILKDNGIMVLQQTDGYNDNLVFPKHIELYEQLKNWFRIIDIKIWKRCNVNFFQFPFSYFYITTRRESKLGRFNFKDKRYLRGIWDYPQDKGSQMNSWSYDFCKMLIESFTKEGDTILDPLAGFSKLLILGSKMNRNCIGYEINKELKENIENEYRRI
jgi:DNA modification methylase